MSQDSILIGKPRSARTQKPRRRPPEKRDIANVVVDTAKIKTWFPAAPMDAFANLAPEVRKLRAEAMLCDSRMGSFPRHDNKTDSVGFMFIFYTAVSE